MDVTTLGSNVIQRSSSENFGGGDSFTWGSKETYNFGDKIVLIAKNLIP